MTEDFIIPEQFIVARRESINNVLDQLTETSIPPLNGSGIDVGCFAGTSCGILEERGLKVEYVEKDPRVIASVENKGFRIINLDILEHLKNCNSFDFLTFFGAPKGFDIYKMVELAVPKLNKGGSVIVTGYPNIKPAISAALRIGGSMPVIRGTHDWDSALYVYSK